MITLVRGPDRFRVTTLSWARTKDAFEIDLMRRIKTALDPASLMNPGKIFLPKLPG